MYPQVKIFSGFAIHSYNLMALIGFAVTLLLLKRELKRININSAVYASMVISSIIGFSLGSRLYNILEHWDIYHNNFLNALFIKGGLAWYGGLIFTIILIFIVINIYKLPSLKIFDIFAPLFALGLAIGRMGCFLAGDGCYGCPTNLPWGMSFPNGIKPISVKVHPTQLYEMIIMLFIFVLLWKRRKSKCPDGYIFSVYLILAGIERFFIEFLRMNERVIFNLTQAQIISILLILSGLYIKSPIYWDLSEYFSIASSVRLRISATNSRQCKWYYL